MKNLNLSGRQRIKIVTHLHIDILPVYSDKGQVP